MPDFRCIKCGQPPEDEGGDLTTCTHKAYDCHHCLVCGQPDVECWCCGECETYPCDCDDEDQGSSNFRSITPWDERGQYCSSALSYGTSTHWTKAWPLTADRTDPCTDAADFYLLEALAHALLNRPNRGVELFLDHPEVRVVAREAQRTQENLIERLDPVYCQYVDLACGGELRHHPAVSGRTLDGNRRAAWSGWKVVRDTVGLQALLDAEDLFNDWTGGGYGGPKWGAGARLLYDRLAGKITKKQWIDRVFALQHNGGVFLNKIDWPVTNDPKWALGYMQSKVLVAHAGDDFGTLLKVASPEVKRLWRAYWVAANHARTRCNNRPTKEPFLTTPRWVWFCRVCYGNPRVGHHIKCGRYAAAPSTGKRIVLQLEESQWGDYLWDHWSTDPDDYVLDENYTLKDVHTPLRVQVQLLVVRSSDDAETVQQVHVDRLSELPNVQFKPFEHSTIKKMHKTTGCKWYLMIRVGSKTSPVSFMPVSHKLGQGSVSDIPSIIDVGVLMMSGKLKFNTMGWSQDAILNEWSKEVKQ